MQEQDYLPVSLHQPLNALLVEDHTPVFALIGRLPSATA